MFSNVLSLKANFIEDKCALYFIWFQRHMHASLWTADVLSSCCFSPFRGREAMTRNTSAARRLHSYQMSAKTISLFDICFKIENRTSTQTNFQKTDTQKPSFVFLSSFSAKDYLKTTYTNLRHFSSLHGIILWLQEQIRKHVKNREKEHSGPDWNNSFFYFYFTIFLIVHFYAFLQQFLASKTLQEAGDSTGRRCVLTTLHGISQTSLVSLISLLFDIFQPSTTISQHTLSIRQKRKTDVDPREFTEHKTCGFKSKWLEGFS